MIGIGIKRLNLLSSLGNRELIGIDFSNDNLKLAHVKLSPNRKELVDILSRDIRGATDDDISKAIRSSFDEIKTKSASIINIIPPHLVITKNIEIPSVNPQEIKEIIDLQAGRHTPYSRDEIIIDYIDIGTYRQSYTKILLIIVARNVIKRHFEILEKAGLRLEKVLFSSECLAISISRILNLKSEDSPLSIIDIDENFTDFNVVFKNKVIFIRSIPMGTQHLIDKREIYESRFVEELRRSFEAYQNENIERSPNMLILTGAIEESMYLESVLSEGLGLTTKAVPYFKNLTFSGDGSKALSLIKRSSFLNVVASLFAWEEVKVELTPKEIKLRKSLEERGRDLIKAGIFILAVFVLIFSVLMTKIYFKGIHLNRLDTQYKSLNKDAQNLEEDFEKVSLVRNYLSGRGYSLEVLAELHSIIPAGLKLNDIRFDGGGKISIRGVAEAMSTVFGFVDDMEQASYFKDVRTKYTAKRKDGLRDVTDFEITCFLNKKDY